MNIAMMGSLATVLCTALGAIPAMMFTQMTHRGKDILLAFTAGIMVSASTYGLIPSALKLSNLFVLSVGILAGTAVLLLLERYVPHEDPRHTAAESALTSGTAFFLIAMALHNLPEGLSVGVGYGSSSHHLGAIVALSIGLQNIPEGFLTALFLIARGLKKRQAFGWAAVTGLVEWLFCGIGYAFTDGLEAAVPYGLAFAAGAMLFVVYKELIPESHGDGNERVATFTFILGLLFMIGVTHTLK